MRSTVYGLVFVGLVLLPVVFVHAETDAERKARLEGELQKVELQILTQQRLVQDKGAERQTLERDISLIEGQITKAQLGIQARGIAIEQLSDQIGEKEVVLQILGERMQRQEQSLADLIRKSAAVNDFSLVEVMLSRESFSEFFSDFARFQDIKASLNESLQVLSGIKLDTH